CFNTINELENYTWQKDRRTNEYINKPVDSFNHCIDAIRYAIEQLILQGNAQHNKPTQTAKMIKRLGLQRGDTMVLKVNEFERALDEYGTRAALLDRDNNIQYISNSLEDIFNGDTLLKFIRHHHSRQKPRLKILQNYYEGKTVNRTMRQRRIEEDRADHRISHPFAEYISDFTNGYFLGKPIRVNFENDNENLKRDINNKLNEVLQYNDIDSVNRLIGLDLSVYGRAYEIVTKNDKDEYRVYRMKPEETFIIYDNSIE